MSADVTDIQCFRQLGPDLLTAGQPLEDQFEAIRAAGCQVIINLADEDATDYLPDEPEIVAALGLEYLNIPVAWSAPQLSDLSAFFEAMRRYAGRRIFLHCARNMRVSAFVYLYRILRLGWSRADSLPDLLALWQPNETWQAFIDTALSSETLPPGAK